MAEKKASITLNNIQEIGAVLRDLIRLECSSRVRKQEEGMRSFRQEQRKKSLEKKIKERTASEERQRQKMPWKQPQPQPQPAAAKADSVSEEAEDEGVASQLGDNSEEDQPGTSSQAAVLSALGDSGVIDGEQQSAPDAVDIDADPMEMVAVEVALCHKADNTGVASVVNPTAGGPQPHCVSEVALPLTLHVEEISVPAVFHNDKQIVATGAARKLIKIRKKLRAKIVHTVHAEKTAHANVELKRAPMREGAIAAMKRRPVVKERFMIVAASMKSAAYDGKFQQLAAADSTNATLKPHKRDTTLSTRADLRASATERADCGGVQLARRPISGGAEVALAHFDGVVVPPLAVKLADKRGQSKLPECGGQFAALFTRPYDVRHARATIVPKQRRIARCIYFAQAPAPPPPSLSHVTMVQVSDDRLPPSPAVRKRSQHGKQSEGNAVNAAVIGEAGDTGRARRRRRAFAGAQQQSLPAYQPTPAANQIPLSVGAHLRTGSAERRPAERQRRRMYEAGGGGAMGSTDVAECWGLAMLRRIVVDDGFGMEKHENWFSGKPGDPEGMWGVNLKKAPRPRDASLDSNEHSARLRRHESDKADFARVSLRRVTGTRRALPIPPPPVEKYVPRWRRNTVAVDQDDVASAMELIGGS